MQITSHFQIDLSTVSFWRNWIHYNTHPHPALSRPVPRAEIFVNSETSNDRGGVCVHKSVYLLEVTQSLLFFILLFLSIA